MRLTTRIAYTEPPNIEAIRARFGGALTPATIYAYGSTIYVPGGEAKVGSLHVPAGLELPPHLIVHEETHFDQQAEAGGASAWWERYLVDDAFRLAQEVQAYRAELAAIPTRADRRRRYASVVTTLAGPLYGRLVSKPEARALLSAGPS